MYKICVIAWEIVVLGGYGEMGTVVCSDLSDTFSGETVIAGRDIAKARKLAAKFKNKNVTGAYADVSDSKSMDTVLRGADVVINATN